MNVFTTDHPLMSPPVRGLSRVEKWLIFAVLCYPVYLLLLGPFYGLVGRGFLDFLPDTALKVCFVPARPVLEIVGPRSFFAYLDWWYTDPNAAETTW